jgi:M6 family metalloprotease-like protein
MLRKQIFGFLIASLFLGLSILTLLQSETIDEAFSSIQYDVENKEEDTLVGFNANESWLVLLVDFSHDRSDQSSINEAKQLIEENAPSYFEQATGRQVNLNIVVHEVITRASNSLSYYGSDEGGERDTTQGEFRPQFLAEEAISNVELSVNWQDFDINGDQIVDRLLILHSTRGQEEGVSNSNRIWSHFTYFEEPYTTTDQYIINHYTMASLKSGQNGIGTLLHEMLHQMGAADLYPAEGSDYSYWNGMGVWDIMSSGNWNGDGRTPSLPSAASMELIGMPVHNDVDLTWPQNSDTPCFGPTIHFDGRSEAGKAIKIPISREEVVWVELRIKVGYDSSLPGNGFLVTYQDTSVGNLEENSVNQNPYTPYLVTIEADNSKDVINGINEGEEDDLFQNGSKFGASGVLIYDHDGILVDWIGEVHLNDTHQEIKFYALNCTQYLNLELDDFVTIQEPDSSFNIKGEFEQPCSFDVETDDSRSISVQHTEDLATLSFDQPAQPKDSVLLSGTIACSNGVVHLNHRILYSEIIPLPTERFESQIRYTETTVLQIPIPYEGEGIEIFDVKIEGPLGRVINDLSSIQLGSQATTIQLVVEPNGLLVSNMIVEGTIVLQLAGLKEWRYEVYLTTDSKEPLIDFLDKPSTVISTFLGFTSLVYFVSTIATFWKKEKNEQHQKFTEVQFLAQQEYTSKTVEVDAWGRQLD